MSGNYMKFYSAIKGAYPDIKIVSNCDGSVQPLNLPADLYDFHVLIVTSKLKPFCKLYPFSFLTMWCSFCKGLHECKFYVLDDSQL